MLLHLKSKVNKTLNLLLRFNFKIFNNVLSCVKPITVYINHDPVFLMEVFITIFIISVSRKNIICYTFTIDYNMLDITRISFRFSTTYNHNYNYKMQTPLK